MPGLLLHKKHLHQQHVDRCAQASSLKGSRTVPAKLAPKTKMLYLKVFDIDFILEVVLKALQFGNPAVVTLAYLFQ